MEPVAGWGSRMRARRDAGGAPYEGLWPVRCLHGKLTHPLGE